MPETTKVLFFLVFAVVTILLVALAPYSWVRGYWRGPGLLPERITNTRWFRGATRGAAIVLLLVLVYAMVFLGWKRN